ncbi:unnamed protein product [Rotaria magnacalcarata]
MFFNIFGETIHSNANETPLQEKPTSSTEKKTRKETHKIRVFPINEDDNIQMRSTARYHQIHNQISTLKLHGHRMSEEEEINLRLGYLGQCLLTQLSYFDHGYSFLTDSLHTIYHGVFVSTKPNIQFLLSIGPGSKTIFILVVEIQLKMKFFIFYLSFFI